MQNHSVWKDTFFYFSYYLFFFYEEGGSVAAAQAQGQKQIRLLEAGNVCQDVGNAYPAEIEFGTLFFSTHMHIFML